MICDVITNMVTLDWKSSTDKADRPEGRVRIVSAPIEHLGMQVSLRKAFDANRDVPEEFRILLAQIR